MRQARSGRWIYPRFGTRLRRLPSRLGAGIGAPRLRNRIAVDVLDRDAAVERLARPLGSVALGQPHVEPQLRPRRLGPDQDPIEHRAGRHLLAATEVDHPTAGAVTDRPPKVLLDLAVGQRRPLAVVAV